MTQQSQRLQDQKPIRPKSVPTQPQHQQTPLTLSAIQTKLNDPATVLQMQRALGNQAVSRYVMQRLASNDAFTVDEDLSGQISSQIGKGSAIGSTPVSDNVGALTGVDVSDTKVHRDSELPAQVGAKAMAVGDTVFFGKGQDSAETMGHELAHIAQNKTGNAPQVQASGLEVTAANSSYEDYADSVGTAAAKSSGQVANMAAGGEMALAAPAQRSEEEDLQMSRLQRSEEEDLQMSRIQRNEEEDLQMSRLQRSEEEEMMQAERLQRTGDEEELMQG
ncbi:MAG: eCIS core domain-containing protein [Candidatus Promineifilaceae bacterium]